ncbi:hypothetical protein F5Y17DRAFT_134866 [Xylariaceae sp. FL0594]|nr:hypothetical protein F5Y17DRAFT_134866 [Xylariaceae sp. FL0594]
MGSINKQISRYETTAVYTHPDAKVDVILVHGLNGEPQKTWTAKNGVFWPTDLLPTSLRDVRANVLVYGYNADVYSKRHGSNPSDNFIYMHAQNLVTSLTHYRKDEMTFHNPIIWVCHSLGGIVVKRALLYSNDLRTSQHEDYRSIYVSTYAIAFLGTPHTGSDIATWGTVLQAMSDAVVPRSFFQSESVLLKTLKKDNETLQNINLHFLDIYQRFKILMAHENHKTDLKGTKMLIVDAQSAGPQLPGVTYYAIEATHSGMCKFDSKNAPGYRTISTAIREWVRDAPDVITTRWRVEDEEKLARAKHEIEERMKPWIQSQRLQANQSTSTSQQNNETSLPTSQDQSKLPHSTRHMLPEPEPPSQREGDDESFPSQQSISENAESSREPLFVKPSVFRPNTYFKGRDRELKALHRMLTDRKRRSVGTSSVLIQSMPGGGKSHLARQYVFQHRYDYPGGIFWIRAKSIQELDWGYHDMAKVLGLAEALTEQGHVRDNRAVVKAVVSWLSSNENWLLILDGIHFDFEGLEHYIPFVRHTSIIYTSTERTTGEEYRFDNPQVLALEPLSKREAQELLFDEMGKKKPYTQDDLHRAEELVQLMGRLPLMIHVAALQLKATGEPLAKYLRSYKSRPKVGHLPAYRAVREQLEHRGAHAALNLISLLAFFGTHIPVEMISLGARALDKRTPVKTKSPDLRKASLNQTFRILIAFALIERNEVNDVSSASSRSARSVDMGHDTLDIIRIHSIVQAFFIDILSESWEAGFWLERAISLYCCAFDTTTQRVNNDPQTGKPEDFRRLLIHGQRLLSHLDRFEKRFPSLATSREDLDLRLDSVEYRIEQLTRRVTEAESQGSADIIVSVFERTNSLSESDPTPSSRSLAEDYSMTDATETVYSPSVYSPTEHGPYHWHVPVVPHQGFSGWETSRTATPQPAPTEVFDSMSMPDDDETTRRVFGPDHRTIRKREGRRYREHAGAWRASARILRDPRITDPRITLSRENARGSVGHSFTPLTGRPVSSNDSLPPGQSDAKISLSQINIGTPKLQSSDTVLSQSETHPTRPRLVAGRPSYANARAEEADDTEFPVTPTFSYPPPTFRETAATIMRLKESERLASFDGVTPAARSSSPLATAPVRTEAPVSSELQPEGEATEDEAAESPLTPRLSPQMLPSRPTSTTPSRPASVSQSRSARSSPSHSSGPFPPPPISIEINSTSSLRSSTYTGSHGMTHRMDEYDEVVPHRKSAPSILPYPTSPQTQAMHIRPVFGGMPDLPAPWVPSSTGSSLLPQGYSSQPMSRDTSHHSSNSVGSTRSLPLGRTSSPTPSAEVLGSSPASQIMQQPQSRRPSVVETEPSPRLSGVEPDPVMTSYHLYNSSKHHSPRGRKRGGSTPASMVAAFSAGPKLLSRIRSIRSRSESRRRASLTPELEEGQKKRHSSSTSSIGPGFSGSPPAHLLAPEMARSGSLSGGIRLDDDTVVEFGSGGAQAAAAVAEARRRSPKPGSSPLAFRPPPPPPSPPRGDDEASKQGQEKGQSGITSPPARTGLGIQPRRES